MKVLVACECSGVVREAFRKRGHRAVSCDLLASDRPGPHYKGDIRDLLFLEGWDLILAFPPCTHLASSGARWFEQKRRDGRQQEGIDFFMLFTQVKARVGSVIENPVGIMSSVWRKPDQIVHPWMFGDEARKSTCLWLDRLPPLQPTNVVSEGEIHVTKSGRRLPKWYNLPPSEDRAKIRSQTFQGIADAMAEQWGQLGN